MTDRFLPHVDGSDSKYGGMQLLPEYKKKLEPKFLEFYHKRFNNNRMVYLHWSAGPRGVNFLDYHRMIMMRPGRAVSQVNKDCSIDMYAHTYGRNRNSCAVSLAGFFKATTQDLGEEVATKEQLRLLVAELSEICCNLNIPVSSLMSHAEAADNVDQGPNPPYPTPHLSGANAEPYGPLSGKWERWDLHVMIDKKTLELHPPYSNKVLRPSGNLVSLMDWVRGETVLRVQDATYKYWGK